MRMLDTKCHAPDRRRAGLAAAFQKSGRGAGSPDDLTSNNRLAYAPLKPLDASPAVTDLTAIRQAAS